jgi:prophage tail gpP-like protein
MSGDGLKQGEDIDQQNENDSNDTNTKGSNNMGDGENGGSTSSNGSGNTSEQSTGLQDDFAATYRATCFASVHQGGFLNRVSLKNAFSITLS